MKAEISEMGFMPQEELIYVSGSGMFPAYVAVIGFNALEMQEPCIIKLPFAAAEAMIVSKTPSSLNFKAANDAVVLGHSGSYLIVKVSHNGEYAAVERGAATGVNPVIIFRLRTCFTRAPTLTSFKSP